MRRCNAYFGGGTLIALANGEFRLSRDVDFVCPVGAGYRHLREVVASRGHERLFRETDGLSFPREARADQYGVRFPVEVDGTPIKVEIFVEARIPLEPAESQPWTRLGCLAVVDQFAEKLLANADRWADDAVEARDLIDLAVLRRRRKIPEKSLIKAEAAYPVTDALRDAIAAFRRRSDFRERCFDHLGLEQGAREVVLEGLDLLATDLDESNTRQERGQD